MQPTKNNPDRNSAPSRFICSSCPSQYQERQFMICIPSHALQKKILPRKRVINFMVKFCLPSTQMLPSLPHLKPITLCHDSICERNSENLLASSLGRYRLHDMVCGLYPSIMHSLHHGISIVVYPSRYIHHGTSSSKGWSHAKYPLGLKIACR